MNAKIEIQSKPNLKAQLRMKMMNVNLASLKDFSEPEESKVILARKFESFLKRFLSEDSAHKMEPSAKTEVQSQHNKEKANPNIMISAPLMRFINYLKKKQN